MDEKKEAQKQEISGTRTQTPSAIEKKAENETGIQNATPQAGRSEAGRSEAGSLIDSANAAAKRTEDAIQALKKENDRAEEIFAKNQLAGRGLAGRQQTPVDIEAEAAKERINAVGRATGARWAQPKEII